MIQKKQYNAIDLLKFGMALLVIMIHVKPNSHSELLDHFFTPLMGIAVPVFFIVSSMLVFKRLNKSNGGVLAYCKRIGLLYLCWFIIDFWFIWINKPYFHVSWEEGTLEFMKDVLFGSSFPGSWYLSASVMGVVIVYMLTRILHPLIVFILTYVLAMYVHRIDVFPDTFQWAYNWYATNFRSEVYLSFPAQMIWISIGQLLSYVIDKIEDNKSWLLSATSITFLFMFVVSLFVKVYELQILMALSLVVTCLLKELPSSPIFKLLRNYSILMFFFHFSIAGKMSYFTIFFGDSLLSNWMYYVIVVLTSVIFAHIVLKLENTKFLGFLKYTH